MHLYWIFAKAPGFGVMVITLAEFAIGFAYGALLEGFWNGQTIGKRLFHLRVIDQAGLPLRIEQAWVRNLMRVFDALPFAYLVGGISVLSSPLTQRFGERVAGAGFVCSTTPVVAGGGCCTGAREVYLPGDPPHPRSLAPARKRAVRLLRYQLS